MEISEYAKANNIDKEPTFAWWVPFALKNIKEMIRKAAMRARMKTKLGVSIPATYDEAVELGRINGNTHWQDATKKEINNVEVTFKFLNDGSKVPIRFKKIKFHLIFDVKFDLTRKARYFGGGDLTQMTASMSQSIVLSRDSAI